MGLKLHQVKALPKVGEWVIWEKLAICNTFRDNSHLLIMSRWVISYGLKLHRVKALPKVGEWVIWENWLSAILLEIIRIYSLWVGE